MLETYVKDEKDSNESLQKLVDELKPLRDTIEYVNNLSKSETNPTSFDSIENLNSKIKQLEVGYLFRGQLYNGRKYGSLIFFLNNKKRIKV